MGGEHVRGNSEITSMPSQRSSSTGLSSSQSPSFPGGHSWVLFSLALPRLNLSPGHLGALGRGQWPLTQPVRRFELRPELCGARACLVLAAPAVLGFQAHVHLWVEGCLSGLRPSFFFLFFFCPSFFGMKMEDEGSNRPPAGAGLSPPHVLLPRASPSSVPRSEGAATSPPQLLSPR